MSGVWPADLHLNRSRCWCWHGGGSLTAMDLLHSGPVAQCRGSKECDGDEGCKGLHVDVRVGLDRQEE